MKLGFALPVCGSWATPDNQGRIARRAEELGYSSLWTAQRLLFPSEPVNEYAAAPGPWPSFFRSMMDPLMPLAYVAGMTERIRLGTASLILPFANPVVLAKQLASLDVLCRGRLDVGVSLGWSKDEYAAANASWERRGERQDEFLRCLIAAWMPGVTGFEGEFYTLPLSEILPGPVQLPHPPILVGGYADAALRRAATYGQGYLGGNMPLEKIVPLLARLRELSEDAHRDPDQLRLVARGVVVTSESPQGPDRRPLRGNLAEVEADIQRYAEAGVHELFLDVNFDPRIGDVGADPDKSLAHALHLLEHLSPNSSAPR